MDPNANLQEQEQHYPRYLHDTPHERARLRELRQALTDWLRGGGFEPDWSQAPNARKYYGR